MSQFYIPDSHTGFSEASDNDDLDTLPFARPLQRSDFLQPNFTPSTYLSTLSHRHQTLEDLRSELRSRSQLLSRELLDLVNANYADFLTLGNSLRGGEEKVENVRVGLLGFGKEVGGLQRLIAGMEEEVGRLVKERRDARKGIEIGRRLVEYDERLRECEEAVSVGTMEAEEGFESDSSEEEEEEEEEGEEEGEEGKGDGSRYGTPIGRLQRNVVQYRLVKEVVKGLEEHPFVVAQAPRMGKVRSTLLLDLGTALQQAKKVGAAGAGRMIQIMKIYADMEESGEAIKVIKTLKMK